MKQVWKYTLHPEEINQQIPKGGQVLCVDEQGGNICMWVEVDIRAPKETRIFKVYGTGHNIYESSGASRVYIGSVKLFDGTLFFHVFEQLLA